MLRIINIGCFSDIKRNAAMSLNGGGFVLWLGEMMQMREALTIDSTLIAWLKNAHIQWAFFIH